jgi:hypothetical protein
MPAPCPAIRHPMPTQGYALVVVAAPLPPIIGREGMYHDLMPRLTWVDKAIHHVAICSTRDSNQHSSQYPSGIALLSLRYTRRQPLAPRSCPHRAILADRYVGAVYRRFSPKITCGVGSTISPLRLRHTQYGREGLVYITKSPLIDTL